MRLNPSRNDIVGYGKSYESQINVYEEYPRKDVFYPKDYDIRFMRRNENSHFGK